MIRDFEGLWLDSGCVAQSAAEGDTVRLYRPGVGYLTRDGGRHVATLELNDTLLFHETYTARVQREFTRLLIGFRRRQRLPANPLVLFLALGNEQIAADALGAETMKHLQITEHLHQAGFNDGKGRLAALKCSVSGQTGVASFDVVKGVCDRIRPDWVIAVDTLAAKRTARLQRAIQISDGGITPGAGVGNAKTPVRADTLGVPVVAIGVPLVIYARHMLAESGATALPHSVRDLIVTPKEIDFTVETFGKLIARSINTVVHCKTSLFTSLFRSAPDYTE